MATENIRINYLVDKSQLESANKELKKVSDNNELTQDQVNKTKDKFNEQNKVLAATNKALVGLGGQLQAIGNHFSIAGKGLGDLSAGMLKSATASSGLSKSLRVLKIALISTGIGAIVVALGSLIAYFTKTQRGANILSKVMSGLGAVVSVLMDRMSAFGEAMVKAFKSPEKIIKGFFNLIKENIVDPIKAVMNILPAFSKAAGQALRGEFDEAKKTIRDAAIDIDKSFTKVKENVEGFIEGAKEGFKGLVDEMYNEYNAAADLDARMQKLRENESALTVEIAKRRAEIKAYNKDAEDTTLTEQERLDAANNAIETETALQQKRIALAKERVDILAKQNALGESMIEDVERENEARAAYFNILMESDEMLTTLQNKRNILASTIKKQNEEQLEMLESISEREQEREEKAAEARINNMMAQTQAFIAAKEKETEAAMVQAEAQMQIDQAVADSKQAALEQSLSLAKGLFNEQTIAYKAASIAQVGISTYKGAAAALEPPPVGAGPLLGPILAGLTIAAGLANAAKIANINPKFEKGGRIGGHLHRNGGTIIEAERDEFVMSRAATAKYGFDFMEKVNNLELNPLTPKASRSNINIVDVMPIAKQLKEMPQNIINIDGEGFTLQQRRGHHIINRKLNRYAT